jgi:GNAT superfamily N-acetyltransferase
VVTILKLPDFDFSVIFAKSLNIMEWTSGEFVISTDKALLQPEEIQKFLSEESYWAKSRTFEQTLRAIENSVCFGLYTQERQIGFARVVTDQATFAYIGDVYVLPEFRGQGLSKWLMETIVAHPDLQGLRRWLLATRDAHGLYAQYDFTALKFPERWMERTAPNAY